MRGLTEEGMSPGGMRPSVISFSSAANPAPFFFSLSFLFLSSSTLVIEDPVSLSLSFLFLSSLRTRGSSVVLFAKTGRSKDPGSPIESGMTEGRQRHACRHFQGASRRGCAPPSFLFLSSLRTRGSKSSSTLVIEDPVRRFCLCLSSFCHPCAREDPVSLSLSFLFLIACPET